MKKNSLFVSIVSAAFVLTSQVIAGASPIPTSTISNLSFWDGTSGLDAWGTPNTATFGETFQASVDNSILNSITFELKAYATVSTQNFTAQVYAWTGSNVTGSSLFTSSTQSFTSTNSYQAVTVNTGFVALAPGTEYMALFTTLGQANTPGNDYFGSLSTDATANSNCYYNNASSVNGNWRSLSNFPELAFSLNFGAPAAPAANVPDAGSTALLLCLALSTLFVANHALGKSKSLRSATTA